MASVDFRLKLKTATDVKAHLRHNDKEMRLKDNHSNKDIDKNLTVYNTSLFGISYEEACKKYDAIIAELDKKPKANKKKNRVTCFGLEIPAPAELSESGDMNVLNKWFGRTCDLIADQYGVHNIVEAYVHYDEIHEYKDAETGEYRVSRAHMHVDVIPEHEGRLIGKWFSNQANMNKLNKAVDEMSREEFGVKFMTGEKRKSRASVEELKNRSDVAELMDEIESNRRAAKKSREFAEKYERDRKAALQAQKEREEKQAKALHAREEALQAQEQALRVTRDKLQAEYQKAIDGACSASEMYVKACKEHTPDKIALEVLSEVRCKDGKTGLDVYEARKKKQDEMLKRKAKSFSSYYGVGGSSSAVRPVTPQKDSSDFGL